MTTPDDKAAARTIIASMIDAVDAKLAAGRAGIEALFASLDAGDVSDATARSAAGATVDPIDAQGDQPRDANDDPPPGRQPKRRRHRPSPGAVLAALVLDKALGPALKRRLRRKTPLALVVQAPGADWVKPLRRAVNALAPDCESFARDGAQRQQDKREVGNPEAVAALARGRHCVGISQTPDRYLPSTLTTIADARITVGPPDGMTLRRLISACVGPAPRDVPDGASSGLSYDDILAAFRYGASPAQVLANLVAASSAKCRAHAADDTPPLDRLPGADPGVRAWGLKLAEDYAAWKRGDIPWKNVDASLVMTGPPGTGKTTLAKSLAATLRLPLFATSVGEWFANSDGHLNEVIKQVNSVFSLAVSSKGILFIDEVDALPNRNTLDSRNRDYWIPLINYVLLLFDSAQTRRDGVVILAASNMHVSSIDPALVRPGRLGRHLEVLPPNAQSLAEVLRWRLGPSALPGADLSEIARLRPGATPALAAQWARDAVSAARDAGRDVTMDDLVAVVAPDDDMSDGDRRVAAVHEAGHAVVGLAVGRTLRSVSILSSGATGGATIMSAAPTSFMTRVDVDAEVRVLLAGRAAESLLLGAPTLGAVADLRAATGLVAMAHASGGLGADLLHRTPSDDPFGPLSFDPALRKTVSDDLARVHAEVVEILRRDIDGVRALADALAARRFLDGADAEAIVRKALAPPRRKSPRNGRPS